RRRCRPVLALLPRRAHSLSVRSDRHPPDLHSFPTRRSSDLMYEHAEAELGLPDLLVTAHGIFPNLPLVEMTAEEWDRTFAINVRDRKSTRLNSSHVKISYAVFCLKKKKNQKGVRELEAVHAQ